MEKDVDINKVVRQHLEMEQFFSGFSLKGKAGTPEPQQQEDNPVPSEVEGMTDAEKAAELEKIAKEVHQCRKCGLASLKKSLRKFTNAANAVWGRCGQTQYPARATPTPA